MSNRAIQNLFACYSEQLKNTKQPLKNLKAIDALTHCRTRALGASYYRCKSNHAEIEQLHSCRHRSCYVCAHKQRLDWIEKQKARLLDVPHFHVIFTLPHEYLSLWRYNEALFARILFKASQETLLQLLAQQRHGGVTPGILIALHTWGRQLTLHPHTHCLVTAGGLDSNNDWKALGDYLVPSAMMRSVYRGKVQSFIKAAFDAGELILPPTMSAAQFWSMYRSVYKKHWCVRIEERYAHGKGVVLYLARYCKGGPVDPRQLKQITADVVKMSYLDHRDQRIKEQRLKPMDFITRLLQHVPPKGLHTIRYYGLYASASTLRYERCRQQCGTVESMPHAWLASAPLKTWSWDITFLPTAVRGQFYRLYMVMDVYSRMIVGWEIHEDERAEHAAMLITKACLRHRVRQDALVLHADNGSPMKGATMLATLQRLGIVPSFSRPAVSDDNAYSEALFRTLKYTPAYPKKPFASIDQARQWVLRFVTWYNTEHRHSGIKFVTPEQRHYGQEHAILERRRTVYEAAKQAMPQRWKGRDTRDWSPMGEVWLNPPKVSAADDHKLSRAA